MLELLGIIFCGFLLDLIIGDPRYRYHPIRIIGQGIVWLEGFLRKYGLNGKSGGILLVLMIETGTLIISFILSNILKFVHPILGWCFGLFIFYSCLALKDLFHHIRPVISALNADNLPEARATVAKVVGRDVSYLDKEGVGRAAVETMSENFVDGFLTPLFWFWAGGVLAYFFGFNTIIPALSLMLAAKVASTLDSMVGYKNAEYSQFGRAGARLDDLMNFVPARLSLIILFLGAWISGFHPINGLRVALRDRLKHDSPNAAHAESFVAGALNIRLGGPTMYHEGIKSKPWIGEGYADPTSDQIRMTERLIMASSWISIIITYTVLLFPK